MWVFTLSKGPPLRVHVILRSNPTTIGKPEGGLSREFRLVFAARSGGIGHRDGDFPIAALLVSRAVARDVQLGTGVAAGRPSAGLYLRMGAVYRGGDGCLAAGSWTDSGAPVEYRGIRRAVVCQRACGVRRREGGSCH